MPSITHSCDMSAEAMDSEVSSSAEFGDNGLVGGCGYAKDDIGNRAEVTSLVTALAATFEKLLTAISGWLLSRQDVDTIAGHMVNPNDISPVISDDRDSFENCDWNSLKFPIVIIAILINRMDVPSKYFILF